MSHYSTEPKDYETAKEATYEHTVCMTSLHAAIPQPRMSLMQFKRFTVE